MVIRHVVIKTAEALQAQKASAVVPRTEAPNVADKHGALAGHPPHAPFPLAAGQGFFLPRKTQLRARQAPFGRSGQVA
jgi:hypothetical protein